MYQEDARIYTPGYSNIMKVQSGRQETPFRVPEKREPAHRKPRTFDKERFKKRYGIALAVIAFFTVWNMAVVGIVHHRTEKQVMREMEAYYVIQLEQYKAEQAQQVQASYFLSGEASREAAINQEIDAVAPVIAKLNTDNQKATEACCMLARVLNRNYPNSFAEVARQEKQWMFYDGSDNTFTEHDRQIAESIIRPYMESGIIPNGLTADMVFGSWSTNDYVLRDSYEGGGTMNTFRYS